MKCEIQDCLTEASFNYMQIEGRRPIIERHLCDGHAKEFFSRLRASIVVGGGRRHVISQGVCVDLEGIAYKHCGNPPGCVVLHEVGGKRRFAMMVDGCAWWALTTQVKKQESPYPYTHVVWAEMIRRLGGALQHVVLDWQETNTRWSAVLHLIKESQGISIDVRAADACTLAVICDVPIFVVEEALEKQKLKGDSGDAIHDY